MITRLEIDNFKSLKAIDLRLGKLNFLVGPNASGKSNFAEALDFVSHVVREGLAYAVAEKGGFYNICHRKQRRARGAISFAVHGNIDINEFDRCSYVFSFGLRASGDEIRSDFYVNKEDLLVYFGDSEGSLLGNQTISFRRNGDKYTAESTAKAIAIRTGAAHHELATIEKLSQFINDTVIPSQQQLLISGFLKDVWPVSLIAEELDGLRVFQLNPRIARQPAAPSVHGDLGRRGENLAAALDRMRSADEESFARLGSWLREVVPSLQQVIPDYTDSRQLGLFFHEEGFGSRWFSEDVSDGTIMSVALFLALLEGRHRNIVFEEPETSLHPWILRKFLDKCREQSESRQIIITTHSPLAVAQAQPDELYLAERIAGVTGIRKALEREAALHEIIRKDILTLGDYWLSGGIGAVPTSPDATQAELFGEEEIDEN